MKRSTRNPLWTAIASACALLATDASFANNMLEEVVVTARKREENLQEVPIAIASFSAQQLEQAQVNTLADLNGMTPGVTIYESGGLISGSVSTFIRGIGNDSGQDSGVGIYIGDVYSPRTGGMLLPVYDLERVEILKGPQGHLYGRNTIGGAIRYIPKEAGEEWAGDLSLSLGEYSLRRVKGNISGKITDGLYLSAGIYQSERDGIQTNVVNGNEYWDEDAMAGRISLRIEPTENFRIKLSADMFDDESAPRLPTRVAIDKNGPTFNGDVDQYMQLGTTLFGNPAFGPLAVNAGLVDSNNDQYMPADVDDVKTGYDEALKSYGIESDNYSAVIEWDINDAWSVKSVTAQRNTDYTQVYDFDGTDQEFIHSFLENEYEDTSQEFQINYTSDNINAVAGYYYLEKETTIPNFGYQGYRLLVTTEQFKDNLEERKLESTSWYFNVDWNINEQWQLSLGGRYTEDENYENIETYQTNINPALATSAFTGPLPIFVKPGTEAQVELLAPPIFPVPVFSGWLIPFPGFDRARTVDTYQFVENEDKWDAFTPSIKLAYFASDDVMYYASFATGFKSGGFNRRGAFESFDEETVETISVGFKSTLMDGRLRFNAEYFYNEYTDKQLTEIKLTSDGSLTQFTGNVGEATLQGFEADISWLATESLLIGLNLGYLDAEIDKYPSLDPNTGEPVDLSKTTYLGYTPEWTATAFFDFSTSLSDGYILSLGARAMYTDDFYTRAQVNVNDYSYDAEQASSYTRINAYAALGTADGHWELRVEGTNLTDEREVVNTFQVGPITTGGYTTPKMWNATLKYSF